jgi:hypothetical protein
MTSIFFEALGNNILHTLDCCLFSYAPLNPNWSINCLRTGAESCKSFGFSQAVFVHNLYKETIPSLGMSELLY